jgi:hypothetical protein
VGHAGIQQSSLGAGSCPLAAQVIACARQVVVIVKAFINFSSYCRTATYIDLSNSGGMDIALRSADRAAYTLDVHRFSPSRHP